MRTCSILTAVLLSMLAIPMIIGSILINGFTYVVLTDATFVANLSPARIQAQVITAIPALLNSTVMNPDDSETADIYNTLFPDPTVRNIAREQMPALMASMDGDFSPERLTQTLATTVPELMTQVVESAPPCTANQERDLIALINASRDLGDSLCAPQDPATQQQLVSYLNQQVTAALRGDTLTQDTTNPLTTMQTQDMTDTISNITLTARQGIIWPATLVIIILALAVRSIRGFCGWLGGLSLISGAGGMGIAALSQSLLTIDVASELAQRMPDQSQIITPFLSLIDGTMFPPYVSWLMTVYSACAVAGAGLVVVALILTPRRPSTPVVLAPLPGTPSAQSSGNDGITAPVAVELDTNAIPIGKVTGPLAPDEANAATDAHQFATNSQATTSELDVTQTTSNEPDTASPSVGGDAQGR
ncbi:MAG: hypothetical protein ACKO83_02150 [Roseiflexaceae bacterium]